MKAVVNAVSAVVEDVWLFEQHPQREGSEVDQDVLKALRERAEATLSNLVTASKTHVTSSGIYPVSLLNATASHISGTVTEIGKTVCIWKASRAEQDDFNTFSSSSPAPLNSATSNGFSPSLRSVEEVELLHQKKASSGVGVSLRRMDVFGSPRLRVGDSRAAAAAAASPPSSWPSGENTQRLASEPSSEDTNSAPPTFDQPPLRSPGGLLSDDSTNAKGSEDAWAELKVRASLVRLTLRLLHVITDD